MDENSADDISRLHSLGALDRRTVLVHGVALTKESAALLRNCGASLVICPTSNRFLFHRTLGKQLIDSIDNGNQQRLAALLPTEICLMRSATRITILVLRPTESTKW